MTGLTHSEWERAIATDEGVRPFPVATLAALTLYGVSFALPYDGTAPGVSIFILGLLYLIYVPFCIPWLANVVFAAALWRAFRGQHGAAFRNAVLAFVLAAAHPFLCQSLPEGPAYYAWAGSMALLAVGVARRAGEGPAHAV